MSLKDHTQAGWRRYFSSSSTGSLISRRKSRTQHLALEFLESRQLLSTTITEYPTPALVPPQPTDVVSLDGKLWFTVFGNAIGMLDPATSPPTIKSYSQGLPAGSGPQSITVGPDGNLWFTELLGGGIGKIDPTSDSIQNYNNGNTAGMPANARPFGITTGPDGQGHQVIWFTDLSNNALGEISPSGTITEIKVPSTMVGFSTFNSVITAGPDGKLYFTEAQFGSGNSITRSGIGIYDPSSQTWSEVTLPSGSNQEPFGLTVGPDGNIWFSEGVPNSSGTGYQSSGLGILNLSSSPPTLSEPAGLSVSGSSAPYQIATGPDGNIWFTLPSAGEVGVVQVESNPANDTISTIAVPPSTQVPKPVPSGITTGPDGNVWFADASGAVGRVTLDTKLVITAQPPATVTPGSSFGLTAKVEYSDTNAVDTAYTSYVTLTLANNPGGSTLSGPTPVAASGGVAVFSGLSLNNPGVGYILQASGGGLTPATTNPFTVSAPVPPPAPQIQGPTVLFTQKTNKNGKPIGKPVLTGYQFTFNTAMNWSITNLNDYQVQIYVPAKGRGRNFKPAHYQAIAGFSLKPMSSTTVQVLTGTQTSTTFKNGGRITLIGTGINSAAGALLGNNVVYSISKGGRSITLA